jgi:hypothetical protein
MRPPDPTRKRPDDEKPDKRPDGEKPEKKSGDPKSEKPADDSKSDKHVSVQKGHGGSAPVRQTAARETKTQTKRVE